MGQSLTCSRQFFFSLVALFGLHRFLCFPYLLESSLWSWNHGRYFLVGTLSDIWVAALFSFLLFTGLAVVASIPPLRRMTPWVAAAVFLVLGLLTTFHQPYVEFFRFQFVPFHLRYLGDKNFLTANLASLVSAPVFFSLVLTAGFAALLGRTQEVPSLRPLLLSLLLLWPLATLGHSLNIHYRVQWFVPQELQVNYWERLYYHLRSQTNPDALTAAELDLLQKRLPGASGPKPELADLLRPALGEFKASELLQTLQERLAARLAAGRKPILLTVLLESARPMEFGAYSQGAKASLTPQFDALAQQGILFQNAYSTGTVTRSGQEAVWCGYLGGMHTSMMRGRSDVRFPCLPELLAGEVESFWFHSGKGEFDNQEAFWRRQGVKHFITARDFASATPKSDWGFSDSALFQRSADELRRLVQKTEKPLLFGMILTITNHIPWDLPADTPAAIAARAPALGHPSFATTSYTDATLGQLVMALKMAGLWQDTVMAVASDHGIAGAPYFASWRQHPHYAEEALSRIALLVSGGLVEEVTQGEQKLVKETVSQADLAGFWGMLLRKDKLRFFSSPLLSKGQRLTPVVADLGGNLYVPESLVLWQRKDLMPAQAVVEANDVTFAAVYFRAFLHSLNHPAVGRH